MARHNKQTFFLQSEQAAGMFVWMQQKQTKAAAAAAAL